MPAMCAGTQESRKKSAISFKVAEKGRTVDHNGRYPRVQHHGYETGCRKGCNLRVFNTSFHLTMIRQTCESSALTGGLGGGTFGILMWLSRLHCCVLNLDSPDLPEMVPSPDIVLCSIQVKRQALGLFASILFVRGVKLRYRPITRMSTLRHWGDVEVTGEQ